MQRVVSVLVVALSVFCQSSLAADTINSHLPSSWEQFEAEHGGSMESLFRQFKAVFKREFASKSEEMSHFSLFEQRTKAIFDWNKGNKQSYSKAINRFTDLTASERNRFVMPETKVDDSSALRISSPKGTDILTKPLKGAGDSKICDLRPFMTAVKDQKSCGSCWAFGTMGAAEGSHLLWSMTDSEGQAVSSSLNDGWQLSEQVLIECCWDEYDSNGCGGGGTSGPMQCALDIGALPSTTAHPYLATTENRTCSHSRTQAGAYVSSWHQPCARADEACLKRQMGGDGCDTFAAVAFKTSIQVIDSFYDYAGGVYSDPACPDNKHNHAVTIVGWGTDASTGQDYWIIRNSWGPDWGLGGHVYMARGSNMCCVACQNLFFQ